MMIKMIIRFEGCFVIIKTSIKFEYMDFSSKKKTLAIYFGDHVVKIFHFKFLCNYTCVCFCTCVFFCVYIYMIMRLYVCTCVRTNISNRCLYRVRAWACTSAFLYNKYDNLITHWPSVYASAHECFSSLYQGLRA